MTSAYIPPPLVAPFAAAVDRSSEPLALERVLVGVEPIRQRDLQDWRDRLPALHIVNGYGPTETTVCATFLDFKAATNPDARTPIGTAAAGTASTCSIADRQPVPIGVHGEIYIGGAGVARGYFNNTRLTDERFIADPFRADGRLYRTGDRGRRLADGNIEFVGRVDHQVKIRGVRIEPGEIVTALETHPRVHEAAVLVSEPHDGARRLVAYVATADATTPTAAELRAHLQQRLPDVMIPAAFVRLTTLPRTANGKIDRDRLPAVDLLADVSEPPKTATEDLLAVIWADVLGVDRVGREQNFFDAGGHSLAAMRVVGRVRDACGVELPLGDVFESPTIAGVGVARGRVATGGRRRSCRRFAREGERVRLPSRLRSSGSGSSISSSLARPTTCPSACGCAATSTWRRSNARWTRSSGVMTCCGPCSPRSTRFPCSACCRRAP